MAKKNKSKELSQAEKLAQRILRAYFGDETSFANMNESGPRQRSVKAAEAALVDIDAINLLEEASAPDIALMQGLSEVLGRAKSDPEKRGYMNIALTVEDRQKFLLETIRVSNPVLYQLCKG